MISRRMPAGAWYLVALAAVLVVAGAPAHAQQATTRRPAAKHPDVLEIRAQAPVPQVVTVRPRLVPAFPASALDSTAVDRHLVSALRAPYVLVPAAGMPPVPPSEPPPSTTPQIHAPPQER
jgi:hypothetical protein